MSMIGGVIFLIGIIGLASILIVRAVEVRNQKRFLSDFRDTADQKVSDVYKTLVLGEIPQEYRVTLQKWMRDMTHSTIVFLARILRAVERPLSRLGHRVRQSDIDGARREPSHYLRTISPTKKSGEKDGKIETDSV